MNNVNTPQTMPTQADESVSSNSKSFAVIILAILLLITLFIFGAYIYFKEIYEPYNIDTTTANSPINTASENAPANVTPTVTYINVSIDFSTELDEADTEDLWSIDKRLDLIANQNMDTGEYNIKGNNFEFSISSYYEDEGWGGTEYKENYKLIPGPIYGDFYRVQSDRIIEEFDTSTYTYVSKSRFKTTGTCEGLYSAVNGLSKAPCGDGMLNIGDENDLVGIFQIYCTAETEAGLAECDRMVASLIKL